ncbi:MAG: NTP transferase domain-containing protein [Gemmatimonadales bacterium]|nr:NTP transferase domain-containing protein [Gemmatimonadales bacterium]NIN50172.1 NTP transferase domain-containing protein [Gemmatimonadales bacterium]NIP07636.1 NTP transferase domain-containing protein [Gemmatimonadales bacterium]NIR01788.1 NTP transferase domain-containing protein [Gemmatimonadales bacterium]NIS65691.1 NTP transferase domain-containing protein [Gemmatimonadales bacterium]
MSRWAAVLAGGSGTRFWPLSTRSKPKQFLPLAGDRPLLAASVARLAGLIPGERILVVTGAPLVEETRRLLPDVPPENVLGEPRPASTSPALAWATAVARAKDPGASVLSLHADWYVGDAAAFRETGARALDVAEEHDVLVTVGIVPSRPEQGYGYIQPGDRLAGDARRVDRFVEKPDAERAHQLIEGGALWNSGLFAWTATRFFAETEAVAPEIAPHLPLLATGDVAGFFAAVTPIAVDISHFERSTRVAVVPGAFPWDDVGTWSALTRVRMVDADGNVIVGNAISRETEGCIIWAEDGPVVVDGVCDLVVVRANGVTLVTTRERAAELKSLLDTVPDHIRDGAS